MKHSGWFLLLVLSLFSCSQDIFEEVDEASLALAAQEVVYADCAPGFGGPDCDQRQIERFLGEYTDGIRWCLDAETTRVATHSIRESHFGHGFFEIHDDLHETPLLAEVDGWNFTLVELSYQFTDPQTRQKDSTVVTGTGWMDIEKGLITYQMYPHKCQVELRIW